MNKAKATPISLQATLNMGNNTSLIINHNCLIIREKVIIKKAAPVWLKAILTLGAALPLFLFKMKLHLRIRNGNTIFIKDQFNLLCKTPFSFQIILF